MQPRVTCAPTTAALSLYSTASQSVIGPCLTHAPARPPPPASLALQTRHSKIEGFFGPGIRAIITPLEGTLLEVALISDGSAAGGLKDDEEVLPPLMPGLAPRVAKKKEA